MSVAYAWEQKEAYVGSPIDGCEEEAGTDGRTAEVDYNTGAAAFFIVTSSKAVDDTNTTIGGHPASIYLDSTDTSETLIDINVGTKSLDIRISTIPDDETTKSFLAELVRAAAG